MLKFLHIGQAINVSIAVQRHVLVLQAEVAPFKAYQDEDSGMLYDF